MQSDDEQDPNDEQEDVIEGIMTGGQDDDEDDDSGEGYGDPDVEDTPDGGAIVTIDKEDEVAVPGDSDFYANLAEPSVGLLTSNEMSDIAIELLDLMRIDRESRQNFDDKYEEGLRRTGLGDDAPGGAQFEGANKVVHPMLVKAPIDFAARAIKELMPANGPAKDYIPGTATPARLEKARRKTKMLNWQLTTQMTEFRSVLERVLPQAALAGSQFVRLVYDKNKKRPVASFVRADKVLVPFEASEFYSAERITYESNITQFEFERRIEQGMYRNVDLAPVSMSPDQTSTAKAMDRIEGKEQPGLNPDGLRPVAEVYTYLSIENDHSCPYIVHIDKTSREVLAIVRNWEETDETYQPMDWLIEFPFVPWDGVYNIGLTHMIGGLSAAATGALRALLDSAHINNFPTGLVLDNAQTGGQSIQLQPTVLQRVKLSGTATDDIRKAVMPLPFNEPSSVLYQLLGFLIDASEDVVRTTFEKLSDNANNLPVGTTLALIEQGSAVVSSIHARLHAAMKRLLGLLSRLNRMYQVDEEIKDEAGEVLAYRSDFDGPLDVVPVSDPNIFSEAQRFAQMQAISQRSDAHPGLYDARKVELYILKCLRLDNPDNLLAPQYQPTPMNQVNENVAMVMGRPVVAYPDQDHLAHMQVLIDFLKSPLLGMLPIIAPTFINSALTHLKEHITLWYASHMLDTVMKELPPGADLIKMMKYKDPEVIKELDRLLAQTSVLAVPEIEQALAKMPPIIQQAQQMLQQLSPPPPMDPANAVLQAKQLDVQARAQQAQSRQQETQQQIQADREEVAMKLQGQGQIARMEQSSEDARAQRSEQQVSAREAFVQDGENRRAMANNDSRENMNRGDNETALTIAEAELAQGQHSRVSTGTGINPQ